MKRLLLKYPRLLRLIVPIAVIALVLIGCGGYYSAEIAGYIKDAENDGGINGAIVRIYTKEPETASSSGFIVETASMASGGNAGYFSHKIVWQNIFPAFGEEGDSGSVWLGITHEDYTERVVHMQGIISDTLNLLPDVLLDRSTFETPQVTGRVLGVGGEGVNGIRVILDLASTVDDPEDYITTTVTVDGETGTYRFLNVTWRDDAPDSATADTETATIIIDDPDYESASTLAVSLVSGQDSDASTDLLATRKPRTEFSTGVNGRCINRVVLLTTGEFQDSPVAGVEVTLTYLDESGAVQTLIDQTDANGEFAFFVQWTDTSPQDFDVADDATIPEGEDGLYIQIQYSDVAGVPAPGFPDLDIDGADPTMYDASDFALKSWINPNYLPDAVVQ